METKPLYEKYSDRIYGVLNCYDRVVLTGTLPQICYAEGMTAYLRSKKIRIFDYFDFIKPFREEIRAHAETVAKANDIKIEFIRKKKFKKEKRIQRILKERGDHPGLVHIFSAMESCTAYKPWHNRETHQTYLKYDSGKCLHYYFYFIDKELGLCYLRVPTWAPFRLQFYFNGHSPLAYALKRSGIDFQMLDNAFLNIGDFDRANKMAWRFNINKLHRKLNDFVHQYCPTLESFESDYHWSTMQAEYATDIVFKRQKDLQAIYPHLLETLIHSVKPENIASFLGRKLHGNYQGEMGNNFNTRIAGTRIRHQMGPVSIKMYDKFGIVLRIEVTVNDISFFKQFREVHHRNGEKDMKWCNMRKSIYSLVPLQQLLVASTKRYISFISEIETPEVGVKVLNKLTQSANENNHSYKGFNLLAESDSNLLRVLLRGEFNINGFTCRNLRQLMPSKNAGQVSRLIKRLRVHGLIKRVGKRYKYYLTQKGRQIAVMVLKLREMYVIPQLAEALA